MFIASFNYALSQQKRAIKILTHFAKKESQDLCQKNEKGYPMPEVKTATVHFIVLETTDDLELRIDSVWYKGKALRVMVPMAAQEILVGKQKATGHKIALKAARNNQLWQLELTPDPVPTPTKVGFPLFRIKGRLGKQRFVEIVQKETELESDQRG